jgi:CRISPR/Cas system-associated endonuclease Cas1
MYRQYAYSNVGDISDTMLASKILSGSNNPIVSSKMITDMQSLNLADKFAKHIGTTLEDYAKKNNLTMQDTIQEFAAAEQKYENAVKNSMINIGNTLLNGINNMTSKLVKSGLLSAKQGE